MAALTDIVRLGALADTELLDRPSLPTLDRYARIAQLALDVPIALVSLVDDHRQFFSSACGLPEPVAAARETPLSHSFCQHVVIDERPLIVEDARQDPRVRDNLAVRDLSVIAYAGMPIRLASGAVLGSFCVIDTEPRVWSSRQLTLLAELAAMVSGEIDLQVRAIRAERSTRELANAVDALEAQHVVAAQSTRQATHDLRTPLQVIAMGIESLQTQQVEPRPAMARLLAMLDRNAKHAVAMVTALHEAGNLPAVAQHVELAELVDLACADLQTRVPAIRIEVHADATPAVAVSAHDLRRCVDNLVTNAQRFARRRIVVAVRMASPTMAEVVVEDDGQGLPALADYDSVWNIRATFHDAEGKSGTGLGLASVRATIEWNGGRVVASPSNLGGAAFGFLLPVSAP